MQLLLNYIAFAKKVNHFVFFCKKVSIKKPARYRCNERAFLDLLKKSFL